MTPSASPPPRGRDRELLPGQSSELRIHDLDRGESTLVRRFRHLVEAPNWTPDGTALIINAHGRLWRVDLAAPDDVIEIDTGTLCDANNDHVLSPDGRTLFITSRDGHIYRCPAGGGTPARITRPQEQWPGLRYYLHGISPDGRCLSFCGLQPETPKTPFMANIFTVGVDGDDVRQLTTGTAPADGPEFSPDGRHLYFNWEQGAARPGHAQLFRMPAAGGTAEQLTSDDRVNWFAHISPDGRTLIYLSYPPGTVQHPANLDVELRRLDLVTGAVDTLVALFGGQGTINVNSFAPDGRRFAYVAYPVAA